MRKSKLEKWLLVLSGHCDYIKIVTEIEDIEIAYYDTNREDFQVIQEKAQTIVNIHNERISKQRRSEDNRKVIQAIKSTKTYQGLHEQTRESFLSDEVIRAIKSAIECDEAGFTYEQWERSTGMGATAKQVVKDLFEERGR